MDKIHLIRDESLLPMPKVCLTECGKITVFEIAVSNEQYIKNIPCAL